MAIRDKVKFKIIELLGMTQPKKAPEESDIGKLQHSIVKRN